MPMENEDRIRLRVCSALLTNNRDALERSLEIPKDVLGDDLYVAECTNSWRSFTSKNDFIFAGLDSVHWPANHLVVSTTCVAITS